MLVLRCTQKLLRRIGGPVTDVPASTTALGDWFVQPVNVGHQRLVLFVSEPSRLPVVAPARDVKNLQVWFPDYLRDVLLGFGVPPADVWRELQESRDTVIASTNSRSVLGSVNDFAQMMKWRVSDRPDLDYTGISLWLADSPCKPLGYDRPMRVARRLLAGASGSV